MKSQSPKVTAHLRAGLRKIQLITRGTNVSGFLRVIFDLRILGHKQFSKLQHKGSGKKAGAKSRH